MVGNLGYVPERTSGRRLDRILCRSSEGKWHRIGECHVVGSHPFQDEFLRGFCQQRQCGVLRTRGRQHARTAPDHHLHSASYQDPQGKQYRYRFSDWYSDRHRTSVCDGKPHGNCDRDIDNYIYIHKDRDPDLQPHGNGNLNPDLNAHVDANQDSDADQDGDAIFHLFSDGYADHDCDCIIDALTHCHPDLQPHGNRDLDLDLNALVYCFSDCHGVRHTDHHSHAATRRVAEPAVTAGVLL